MAMETTKKTMMKMMAIIFREQYPVSASVGGNVIPQMFTHSKQRK